MNYITEADLSKVDINYFDSVGLAYLELEELQSDFQNWYDVIGRANDIVVFYKRK